MIIKRYEFYCDHCDEELIDAYSPTIKKAKTKARKTGWIFTKEKKHFCCKECFKSYKDVIKIEKEKK